MTDQDRGAYAPPSDAPLTFETFDARSRARRPLPMTLIGSVVVLAVLGAAAFMFYRSGSHDAVPQPVGAALGPIKSAPAAGTQPRDPGASLDVYSPQNVPTAAPKAPAFAPAPEQPLPRPAPKPVAAPTPAAPAPGLKVEAVKPAPVHLAPPPVAAKPAPAVQAKPLVAKAQPAPAPAKADVAVTKTAKTETTTTTVKTAPTKVAVAKPAPAPATPAVSDDKAAPVLKASLPAAAAGGAAVQIGAFSSASLADKGYGDVAAKMSGRMAGHSKAVEPLARDGKTLYRTTVRGFAGRADAVAFCEALRAKGSTCIVKG